MSEQQNRLFSSSAEAHCQFYLRITKTYTGGKVNFRITLHPVFNTDLNRIFK